MFVKLMLRSLCDLDASVSCIGLEAMENGWMDESKEVLQTIRNLDKVLLLTIVIFFEQTL